MVAKVVFDERVALDIVDDLISKPIKNEGLVNKPSRLVILPDRLSEYQLKSYILRKKEGKVLDDLTITTFEDLASRITMKQDIIDSELLGFILTAGVLSLSNPIAKKLNSVISDTDEPEKNPAIEQLALELTEYCGYVDPSTLSIVNRTKRISKLLTNLDALLIPRAERNLEFFRALVTKCEKTLMELGIQDTYLTRAHLISDAASKLTSASLQSFIGSSPIDELYVLGIPIFDNTLLRFLKQLILNVKGVVIGVTPKIAKRTKERLSSTLSNSEKVTFETKSQIEVPRVVQRYAIPDRRREIEFSALRCLDFISPDTSPTDVLLISRLAPDYRPYFEPVFNEFGLPAFMRTREALIFSPVYRLVESILSLLVKFNRKAQISASDIAQPLRLGFPTKKKVKGRTYRAAINDRRFLAIETNLEQMEHYSEKGLLGTWLKRLNDREQRASAKQFYFLYTPVIELLEWVKDTGRKKPDVNELIKIVRRFINVYGVEKDYPLLGLISHTRFEITNEHISSQANRVLAGLYQIVRHQERMSSARALLREADKSTSWSDTLRAYRGLVGGKTYGKVQSDSDAFLFVDAGISHFIDASHRIVVGLNNEQFPRKQSEPFLLFQELREELNQPKKGLFIASPSTQMEIENYLYVSAVGRASNVILTMNYLDDRGHKQDWSVFVEGDETGEVLAHELRVELSKLHSMPTTSNTTTVLFDYLRGIRSKMKQDISDDLSAILNLPLLPQKWADEVESIATSVSAMNERVINGKFDPLLKLGPSTMVKEVFKTGRVPSTWEIDMVTYCPAMYYYYIFYYLLPHSDWIKSKENTDPIRYVPAYKEGFMGKTPLPVWRTQFSTRGIRWIETNLGTNQQILSESERDNLANKVDVLHISPAEKSSIRTLLSMITELPGGFNLKPSGTNSTGKYWRPFLISQRAKGYRILPYKLRPHRTFPFTHFQHGYQVKHCSEASGGYKAFDADKKKILFATSQKDAISAIVSIQEYTKLHSSGEFKKLAWDNGLCDACEYNTLCGNWGF